MKRRIMSRVQIVNVIIAYHDGTSNSDGYERRKQAELDTFLHLLADGQTVKVYKDRDMGGWIVETTEE